MGHYLTTENPSAVERMKREALPLPAVGDLVNYYPRTGEVRRGRTIVAALVLHVDERNRRLDLCVFHDANDLIQQDNVPERVENERGWSRKEVPAMPGLDPGIIAALRKDITEVRNLVLGDFEAPGTSVLDLLDKLDERIGKIEDAAKVKAPPAPKKKKRGRPPKAKAPTPTSAAEEPLRKFGNR